MLGRSAGDVWIEGHYRNAPGFEREMSRQVQGPSERAAVEASHHFGRKFAAGLAIGGALIGAGLVKAGRSAARGIQVATDKASDLNETINKTNVIFGRNAAEIQKWSRGSARNMGLSRQEALANASAFGDMFLQLKIGAPQATNMSKRMVELAADFASFSNADISDVLLAQQSAFRGEYDALQRFVPGINAARVEQEALRETHKKSAKDLTLAEKAQATYNIMLKDGKRATGDFKRTSDQLANTRRIEKAQIEDLQASFGKRLLPAQLAVHRAISEKLLPALGVLVKTYGPAVEGFATRWATKFADVIPSTKELTLGLDALGAAFAGNGITTSGDSFVGKMERIGVAARDVVDWFKELKPQFSGVGKAASDLGPALAQSGGAGHVLANSLAVVAPILDVVARNIHNIVPLLPALVGGFLAFKTVQTAIGPVSALGEAIRNFATPALVVATFAQARANKALAVSLGERTVAAVAASRADAGLVVSTTAAGNAAGAAAGKFTLFGTSLSGLAGKLGLFAAAAAAGAYQGKQLGDAIQHGTVVSGPFADARAKILRTLGFEATTAKEATSAQHGLTTATSLGTVAANSHAAALRNEQLAADALKGALHDEKVAELDVRQAKLSVATAQERLTQLTKDGRKGSLDYRQAEIDLKRAKIDLKDKTDALRAATARSTDAERTAASAASKATGVNRSFATSAYKAGEAARLMGIKAMNAIQGIPSHKVSVIAKYNATVSSGVLALMKKGSGPAARLASGGSVRGPGTTTSDSIPGWLSNQEHVVDADAVKGLGRGSHQRGHTMLDALRSQWRHYAAGGPVLRFSQPGASEFLSAPGRFNAALNQIINLSARGFVRFVREHRDEIFGAGSPAVKRFIKSTDPLPYIWGGAGPAGYDCSGLVGAVALAHRHKPYGHGQRVWTTSSIRAGQLGIQPGLGGVLQIGVTPARGHMVGRYGNLGFEAESTRTGIKIGSAATRPESMARHFHMAKGGKITKDLIERYAALAELGIDIGGDAGRLRVNGKVLDRGGYLMPGVTVAHNNTGRPERVLPPGTPTTLNVTVDLRGSTLLGGASEIASKLAPELRTRIRDAQRRAGVPAAQQLR